MRTSLTIMLTTCLLLLPFSTGAEENIPPVSQPLVREGDFAVELAPLYGLGSPETEAEAEDLLSRSGVLPANGWISDYPVTPDILWQLQESAASSAQDGKLLMTADEAGRVLFDLADRMGLPVPAGPGKEEEAPAVEYQQPVINNYYSGYGPPIITYYPPPSHYLYLYTWVPSPAWWYGYWFPGFYICNTFSTTIVVHARTVYVRNRFVEPITRRVVHVVPVTVTERNIIRPVLRIRTEDGRQFANMRDMRRHWGATDRKETRTIKVRPPERRTGYSTPEKRRAAGRIYSNAVQRREAGRQDSSDNRSTVKLRERQSRSGSEGRTYIPRTKQQEGTYAGTGRNSGSSKRDVTTTSGRNSRAERVTTPQQKQYQGAKKSADRSAVTSPGRYAATQKSVQTGRNASQKREPTARTGRYGRSVRSD